MYILNSKSQELDMPVCNGDAVKKLRLEAMLSANKLARYADLDRGTISAIERGKYVSEISVAKLLSALSGQLGREIHNAEVILRDDH